MSSPPIVRIRDVMHSDYSLVDGLITVADALQVMQKQQSRVLIVRKRDDDDEYGLVLPTDIAKQVMAPNRAPERVNVYEIMSKPVISVPPTMQLRYCARLFQRFGLSLAPVIDASGKIVGIVSHDELVLSGLY
ncbi:CBS domain-containing protein [Halomonas campisalis]|uniref:CBS domain-containing protein n=1 Tax=Billgrantia campisalis TaxID=74661 RepID=A0ABS9P785_9GAMM|nr:CBS domain-containing protein [Halomonas campisalis]MCG6657284.1 CBS domain-containing protein [Halomonas campisalis]MDR5864174.1 CBS domain-containing protein [Halomonas campisalis]